MSNNSLSISPLSKTSFDEYGKIPGKIEIHEQIGRGGYGQVYACSDDKSNTYAIKIISHKKMGIPSLIEASIMSTIYHPYINYAVSITSKGHKLYILQELAISDLRVYLDNHSVPRNIKINWIHHLAEAIKCLHTYGIIHGDIKANNILVYNHNRIKLTDFTLSTSKSWSKPYHPCTITHRPLEGWLKNNWGPEVDIWAYGCTIYQIMYEQLLFVNQDRQGCINAILEWNTIIPKEYQSKVKHHITKDFYYSPTINTSINLNDNIQRLMVSCLQITPSARPTIFQILSLDYMRQYNTQPSIFIDTPVSYLSTRTRNKIINQVREYIDDERVIGLVYELYRRTVGIIHLNDNLRLIACIWIGYKMIYRTEPDLGDDYMPHEILRAERTICDHLAYRLLIRKIDIII